MRLRPENAASSFPTTKPQVPQSYLSRHFSFLRLLPLVFAIAHSQYAGTASLSDAAGDGNDVEQAQIAQEDDHQSNSEDGAELSSKVATEEEVPLQLSTEDGVENSSTVKAPTDTPQGNMDGAVGFLRMQEQFNHRLSELLKQSTSDNRNKQRQLDVMQEQLSSSLQFQKRLRASLMNRVAEEDKQLAAAQSRAEAEKTELHNAAHALNQEQRTVTWLRARVNTLLLHLNNVTHLGRVMEKALQNAGMNAAIKTRQIAALQREVDLQHKAPLKLESALHKVQTDKGFEESRLRAEAHDNILLKRRMLSMSKRDEVLQMENSILRQQLRNKDADEQGQAAELAKVKVALAEAQKDNVLLQDKYAETLAGGGAVAVDAIIDGAMPSMAPISENVDETQDGSLLMQLEHDSHRLSVAMSNATEHIVQKSTPSGEDRFATMRVRGRRELTRDSQGLNVLLKGISNSTKRGRH